MIVPRLRTPVNERDHSIGPPNAPVTLVEYGDFECPHCARAHPIVKALRSQLKDRMRFVFRHFPLATIHPHAEHAHEAAESVAAHAGPDAFWAMHHLIYVHQQDSPDALDDAHLAAYAEDAGADPDQVRRDLEADAFLLRVRADFLSGMRSGVNGTPTFFINELRWDGNWTNPAEFLSALEEAAAATAAS
jgi:protein-disulfide isomerase